eukprot:gene10938-biopygen278
MAGSQLVFIGGVPIPPPPGSLTQDQFPCGSVFQWYYTIRTALPRGPVRGRPCGRARSGAGPGQQLARHSLVRHQRFRPHWRQDPCPP